MTPFNWPPGLLLLADTIPKFAFPPLVVLAVHQCSPYKLPNYIWTVAYLLVTPSIYIVLSIIKHFREEQEIKRLGARKVPQVLSFWPGGLDLVWNQVKSFVGGYPGTLSSVPTVSSSGICMNSRPLERLECGLRPNIQASNNLAGAGTWINISFGYLVLITLQIATIEPEHIKVFQTLASTLPTLRSFQSILATDFDNFEKGDTFRWYMQSVLGTGVFNSDGDMWK